MHFCWVIQNSVPEVNGSYMYYIYTYFLYYFFYDYFFLLDVRWYPGELSGVQEDEGMKG